MKIKNDNGMLDESNITKWHSKEQRTEMAVDMWLGKQQQVVQPPEQLLEQLQHGLLCEHCKTWRMEPQHMEPVDIRSHGRRCIRRERSRGKRITVKKNKKQEFVICKIFSFFGRLKIAFCIRDALVNRLTADCGLLNETEVSFCTCFPN